MMIFRGCLCVCECVQQQYQQPEQQHRQKSLRKTVTYFTLGVAVCLRWRCSFDPTPLLRNSFAVMYNKQRHCVHKFPYFYTSVVCIHIFGGQLNIYVREQLVRNFSRNSHSLLRTPYCVLVCTCTHAHTHTYQRLGQVKMYYLALFIFSPCKRLDFFHPSYVFPHFHCQC